MLLCMERLSLTRFLLTAFSKLSAARDPARINYLCSDYLIFTDDEFRISFVVRKAFSSTNAKQLYYVVLAVCIVTDN